MKQLAESSVAEELQSANEAETRLRIIDEVLALLGWDKSEYNPERATSNNTFTDYLLTTDGERKLIVEAKRAGVIQPFDRAVTQSQYKNSILYNHFGDQMQALLEQCRRYSSDCGVPFAVATTGVVWIVLVCFKPGVDWGRVNALVFHSLDDISDRFNEFYALLSRDAVKKIPLANS